MRITNKGFTLVEMMVSVVVIGFLASIAIPAFKTYQMKSRQSEAKLLLSAVYTAEMSHYADGQGYSACLSEIYKRPTTNTYYAMGFATASNHCGPTSTQSCLAYLWNGATPTASCPGFAEGSTWFNATMGIGGNIATQAAASRVLESRINSVAVAEGAEGHFMIEGHGFIGMDILDIWQIDGRKKLRNFRISVSNPSGSPD
jgi:type IV pilus assembly protein PilA